MTINNPIQVQHMRNLIVLVVVLTGTLLSGCWSSGTESLTPDSDTAANEASELPDATPTPEPALKEIPTTDVKSTSDANEAQLVYRAKKYLESGVYTEAKESLQAILSNYPLGAHAEFAEIKMADATFEMGDFSGAAARYEDFYKNHPASEASPYILFRAARSNHLAQRGLGRDVSTLEKAVKFYDELSQKFPESSYFSAAKEYRLSAHEDLAAYEESIASFYKKRQLDAAAEARLKSYNDNWVPVLKKDSEAKEQAPQDRLDDLTRMASNLSVDTKSLRPENPTLISAALVPAENTTRPSASTNTATVGQPQGFSSPTSTAVISQIECREGSVPQVWIYLNKEIQDPVFIAAHRTLTPTAGKIALKVPAITGNLIGPLRASTAPKSPSAVTQRCSNGRLITVSGSGELTMQASNEVEMLSVNNPPRLVFLFK